MAGINVTLYIAPLILTALFAFALAVSSWPRRQAIGARSLIILLAAAGWWSLAYAVQLSTVSLNAQMLWGRLAYFGLVTVAPAWFIFSLQYTGREQWLKWPFFRLIYVVPVLTLILALANEAHHLIWLSVEAGQNEPLYAPVLTFGAGYWLHRIYANALMLFGSVYLFDAFRGAAPQRRWQYLALLTSPAYPWLGNLLSVVQLNPIPDLDWTPVFVGLAAMIFTIGRFRLGGSELTPIARRVVMDNMRDGVVVLDALERIVDLNPAAASILNRPRAQLVGCRLEDAHFDGSHANQEHVVIDAGVSRNYEVRRSELRDELGKLRGHLVVFYDVTDLRRSQAELVKQKQLFENLVAVARSTSRRVTLRETLRNIISIATSLTGSSQGAIFLLDDHRRVTHSSIAHRELTIDQQDTIVPTVMDSGLAGWAVKKQESVLIPDTRHDSRWITLPDQPYEARSALAVPIVHDKTTLGVLTLQHPQPHHFDPTHLRLMQAAADQMALALRNAGMYEEQRRHADLQALLYQVLHFLGREPDLDKALNHVSTLTAQLMRWPGVVIQVFDPTLEKLTVRAAEGPMANSREQTANAGHSLSARAFAERQTLVVENCAEDPELDCQGEGVKSCVAVPIQHGGEALGVLLVQSARVAGFSEDDVLIVETLADTVAMGLANFILFHSVLDERSRLQALVAASSDGILLIGLNQRILVVNRPVLRMLGLSGQLEDWVGESLATVLWRLRRRAPALVRLAAAQRRQLREDRGVLPDQEVTVPPYTLRLTNLPVRAGDTLMGRLVILRDVTEEQRVARLREDLIHTMVHDLRNPLTSINTALSILKRMGLGADERAERVLNTTQNSADRMLQLVNAILEIEHLESGQIPLIRAPVSLAQLVDAVVDMELPLAEARSVRIEDEVPADLAPVLADHSLIERVLQNLIGNALKFVPEEGQIWIRTRMAGDHVLVSIQDTGPGIQPAIQERLFEKFVTGGVDASGSGLGLAFCRMVVEAHGGHITVDSIPGDGATFTFSLPLAPAAIRKPQSVPLA